MGEGFRARKGYSCLRHALNGCQNLNQQRNRYPVRGLRRRWDVSRSHAYVRSNRVYRDFEVFAGNFVQFEKIPIHTGVRSRRSLAAIRI